MYYTLIVLFFFFLIIAYLILKQNNYKNSLNYSHDYKSMKGEYNQDILIYHLYFEKNLIRKGFFIEIGAHDGYSTSNTLFFEKILNWRGLLIESNPENCKILKRNSLIRKNSIIICSPICTSDYVSIKGKNYRSKLSPYNITNKVYRCKKLSDICKKYEINRVDFFSLDVEGSEGDVLDTFNFTIPVSYIMIEKGNHINYCEKKLFKLGYKKEFIFRSPVDYLYSKG